MLSRDRGRYGLLITAWIAWFLVVPSFVSPSAADRPDRVVDVLVFSPKTQSPLIEALGVDTDAVDLNVITNDVLSLMTPSAFNISLARADVIFIDRYLPQSLDDLHLLESYVNGTVGRAGVVMFGFLQNGTIPGVGDFTSSQLDIITPILPVDISTAYMNSTVNSSATGFVVGFEPVFFVPPPSQILANCIPWDMCPLVDRRVITSLKQNATRILAGEPGNETLVAEQSNDENGSRVIFFSMEILENNIPFTSSIYFDYLMYVCAFHAMANSSDELIESWDEWPFSPGHGSDAPWAWIVVAVALLGVVFWLRMKSNNPVPKHQDNSKLDEEGGASSMPSNVHIETRGNGEVNKK